MVLKTTLKLLVNPNKPNGLFINAAVSIFSAWTIYQYFGERTILLRSLLAPALILLNLWELPKGLGWIQAIYWPILLPAAVLFGLTQSPTVLYTAIEVYLYYHSMEAIPQIFSSGETLMNSHVLTSIFQFALTPFDFRSAIILYPVSSFFFRKV